MVAPNNVKPGYSANQKSEITATKEECRLFKHEKAARRESNSGYAATLYEW